MIVLYGILAYSCIVLGSIAGLYLICRAFFQKDFVMSLNLGVLGIANIFVVIVYLIALVLSSDFIPNSMSVYMRPANLLLLVVPSLIVIRTGI